LGVAQSILTLIVLLSGPAQAAERANPEHETGTHTAAGHRDDSEHRELARWRDASAHTQQHSQQRLREPLELIERLRGSELETAAAIAACESGHRLADGSADLHTHDWQAQHSVSTASGAFQFIDGTWRWVWQDLIGEDPPAARARDAEPHEQLRAFLALWRDGAGAHHWDASRSCWQTMLDRTTA
jgi:hypothetical protein